MLTPEEYMKSRVDEQVIWMEAKSAKNKRYYTRLKIIEIFAAALIPFLAVFKTKEYSGDCILYITSSLGVLIVIINAIQQLQKYYDNWTRYRTASENMKREKILYETATAPYDNPGNAFSTFVTNVENILANESKKWQDGITKDIGKTA